MSGITTKSNTILWYADMYFLSNTTVLVIDTSEVWHAISLSEITSGLASGWTFEEGIRGTDISAYATSDAGTRTKVSTVADNTLSVGVFVTLSATTNYNAIFEVMEIIDSKNFTINKAWDTNDDAIGTYAMGGTLVAGASAAGIYTILWNFSISPEVNAHTFGAGLLLNGAMCTKCRACQKLGTAGDFNTMSGNSIIEVAAGDRLAIAVKNVGATGNCTIRHGYGGVHRL